MKKRLFLGLLFLVVALAHGQQYRFTNYSLNQGLAQSQVFCIAENHDGYLFFGTRGGGLSRFNGLEFETFSTAQNLSGNYINDLFEDTENVLWVATNLGLSSYRNNIISTDSFFDGRSVSSIAAAKNTLFVVAENKLFARNENGWDEQESNIPLKIITTDLDGNLWALAEKSVLKYGAAKTETFAINALAECFAFAPDSTLWLGTYGDGVHVLRDGKFVSLNKILGLENAIVNGVFCEADKVWISTLEKGVCVFSLADSSTTFLTEENGLANNHAKVTFKDSWGNYWLGTSGGGVSKYAGQYFKKWSKKNGLQGEYIYQVFEDFSHRKWVATSGGGVTLFDTTVVHFDAQNGFLNQKVKAIFQTRDSAVWVGTEGAGLAIFTNDTILFFNTRNGLSGNWVKDFAEDDQGQIWVATSGGGLSKFMPDSADFSYQIKTYSTKNGLISNGVNALAIDSLNRLWYSTQSSGLGLFWGDTALRNFSTINGLQSNTLRSLHIYKNNLWIGGARGLNFIALNADSIAVMTPQKNENLASQNVYLLQHDLQNNLWVGTEKGVDQIKLSGTNFLEIKHFGGDNGFDGVETNTNATALDHAGNVWFGTVNGLYQFLGDVHIPDNLQPKLSFTNVLLSHVLQDDSVPILDFSQNRVALTYIGISQTFPKKVRYKWRLLGLDTAWSEWTNQRAVDFLNLPPGNYLFSVFAKNEDGFIATNTLDYAFVVATPYWQKLWFKLAVGLAVLLLIVVVFRARVNAVKVKSKRENERILLQSKVIQLQQKALQLQMNPHFIFNTLNSIQALIATKEEDVARTYLTRFSKLMRSILEESRANSTVLEDEIEMLKNYLHLEQFCYEDRFDFTVEVAPDTETELIKIPSMILQPFVENAILHGATKSTQHGHVRLRFSATETHVLCRISDNGPGIQKEKSGSEKHQSHAIAITTERLQLLNSEENAVQFTNETNAKNEVIGLSVLVKLPIL